MMLASLLAGMLAATAVGDRPLCRVGLTMGEPIGLTVSVLLGDRIEVHGAGGTSFGGGRDRLLALDVVYRFPEVIGSVGASGGLVVWLGAGARYASRPDGTRDDLFGVRAPVGLSWVSSDGELEIFSELVPGVSVAPEQRSSLDGGLGIRLALF